MNPARDVRDCMAELRREGKEGYQFSAMMLLPKSLILWMRGFLRRVTLAIEERFFFFWSSRPMVVDVWGEG